jgi:asparagine synthase (glutamine-hydrolysing)
MGLTSFLKGQSQKLEVNRQSHRPGCAKFSPIVHRVLADHRTYLSPKGLFDLAVLVSDAELKGLEGQIIEAGCALGGSTVVMTSAKSKSRKFFVYDTFGMIPPPSERDGQDVHERYAAIVAGKSEGIGGDKYYGYRENLLDEVSAYFAQSGYPVQDNSVQLVRGLFQDTIAGNDPVVIAHIDCDWYESVMTCMERIVPRLVSGGTIVFDDYEAWSGCRTAVDDYFAERKQDFVFKKHARLHVTKR